MFGSLTATMVAVAPFLRFFAKGVIILFAPFDIYRREMVFVILHTPYYHGYIRNAYSIYDNVNYACQSVQERQEIIKKRINRLVFQTVGG